MTGGPEAERTAENKALRPLARTERERQEHYDSMERMREAEEDRVAALFSRAIGEQIEAASRKLGSDWEGEIDGQLEPAYREAWESVFILFAGRTYDALIRDTKDFTEADVDAWTEWVNAYLDNVGAERITLIDDTTKDFVRSVLKDGIEQGWGTDKIARELRDRWAEIDKTRSLRIARTEIVGASNAGSIEGAKATGLELVKRWSAVADGRTRESHLPSVTGAWRVPMDEDFPNGLAYPGDPKGDAAEVIQCRCAVVYEVVG